MIVRIAHYVILAALVLLGGCSPADNHVERTERMAIGEKRYCEQRGGVWYWARGEKPICIKRDAILR
jgi:hypothetical protein